MPSTHDSRPTILLVGEGHVPDQPPVPGGRIRPSRETLVVPDVNAFPGHIACDDASRSEIVVPIVAGGQLRGVLDVDAPETNRFDDEDRLGVLASVRARGPDIAGGPRK